MAVGSGSLDSGESTGYLQARERLFENGETFLRKYGLKVFTSKSFIPQDGQPYVMATDRDPFVLHYGRPWLIFGTSPVQHESAGLDKDIVLFMQVLEYELHVQEKIDEKVWHTNNFYRLQPGQPLNVALNSEGWGKVLRQLEKEYPGQITFA